MILYRKKNTVYKKVCLTSINVKKKNPYKSSLQINIFFLDVYDIYTPTKVKHHPVYIRILTINFKIVGPLLKNVYHLIIFSKVQKSAWNEYK